MREMDDATPEITHNPQMHRYELRLGGQLAGHIAYRERGGAIDLVHTEVDRSYEGRGLAAKLAQHALEDVRSKGRKVIASCEYVAKYVARNPQYGELLAQ